MTKKAFFRSFFVLLGASLAGFASCTNEDESVNNGVPVGGGKAAWTFEVGADGSRTQLDENNKVVFKRGDAISVFNNADAKNDKFVANKDEDFPSGDTAKTAIFNGYANIGAQHFAILYPYQGGDSAKAVSVSSGAAEITATIPAEQTATEGNFDPKANVSVAVTDAHAWDVPKFYLKNVVGLLKFTPAKLTLPDGTTVEKYDSVAIRCAEGGNIAGKVKITVSSTSDPVVSEVIAGSKKVSLKNVEVGKIYYIAMLPKTTDDVLIVDFWSGPYWVGACHVKNSEGKGPKITRSKIMNVGKVTPKGTTFTAGNDGHKVVFAKGNLYYDKSGTGGYWKFEANQYDFRTYPGNGACINGAYNSGTGTPNNHYGLLGWGDVPADGNDINTSSGTFQWTVDWGTKIGDGTTWRTLTGGIGGEWEYICNTRPDVNKFARAKYKGVNGLMLLPDGYGGVTLLKGHAAYGLADANVTGGQDYPANNITDTGWKLLENAGCTFLPCSGDRTNTSMYNVGSSGSYWSSSVSSTLGYAYGLRCNLSEVKPYYDSFGYIGRSVRLVSALP